MWCSIIIRVTIYTPGGLARPKDCLSADLTPAACAVQGGLHHLPAALAEAVAGHGDATGLCRRDVAEAAVRKHLNKSPVSDLTLVANNQTLEGARRRTGVLSMGSPTNGACSGVGDIGLGSRLKVKHREPPSSTMRTGVQYIWLQRAAMK
jgi:hypothetical protein